MFPQITIQFGIIWNFLNFEQRFSGQLSVAARATCLHDIFAQIVATLHSRSDKESDFILFGVLFEKIELPRFGVPRRMKYLVSRQRTPIAHPRLASSLARFPPKC